MFVAKEIFFFSLLVHCVSCAGFIFILNISIRKLQNKMVSNAFILLKSYNNRLFKPYKTSLLHHQN